MGRVLFIADAHLTPGDERTFKIFNRFVTELLNEDAGQLFIMGDFFDFWFEYKNFIMSSYFSVLESLRRLTNTGWKVNFIVGNHDFTVGDTLQKITGMKIYTQYDLRHNNKLYRLEHGDLQMGNDFTYHLWCFVMRRKITMCFWSLLPPLVVDWMIALIIKLSRGVTKRGKLRERTLYDVMKNYECLNGYDGIICGHLHDYQDFIKKIDGCDKRFSVIPAWYVDAPEYAELLDNDSLIVHNLMEK